MIHNTKAPLKLKFCLGTMLEVVQVKGLRYLSPVEPDGLTDQSGPNCSQCSNIFALML